jgi:hypothetical protein
MIQLQAMDMIVPIQDEFSSFILRSSVTPSVSIDSCYNIVLYRQIGNKNAPIFSSMAVDTTV